MSFEQLRREYTYTSLDEYSVHREPIAQFKQWLSDAITAQIREPHAMTLATATRDAKPSARIVLLKEVTHKGFVFCTNDQSRKGVELTQNPHACLVFFWPELERQVRVSGIVQRLSQEESSPYFQARPLGSQLTAWASAQSYEIANRTELETKIAELEAKYEHQIVPCPPFWGGYRLMHQEIEFWQGRPNRMHDRLLYQQENEHDWRIVRLAP